MTVEEKLNELKRLDDIIKSQQADRESEIESILTSEIKKKIVLIDVRYKRETEKVIESVKLLEEEIKQAVLEGGVSVKGVYQVVYSKGRTIWDTKALNGYVLAHPEIEMLRKVGKPSVRIKR